MTIGYLGPTGTFSEHAAAIYQMHCDNACLVPYKTIYDAISAVSKEEMDECVVPLENSIGGAVVSTIDMLMLEPNLFIQAEMVLPVKEDLLVRTNFEGEIKKILSHPQALEQCSAFIHNHYPNCEMVPVHSTAEAARMVSESEEPIASLSPARAAEAYHLKVLHKSVQDDNSNETRFVVVSKKKPKEKAAGCKTSVVFSTQNKPGDLYRILDIFAIWDLNMTKIESRPKKHQLGTYMFFVDLETQDEDDLLAALKMVARKTSYYKFLGSYPVLK